MTRQVDAPYFAGCEPPLADLLSDPILQMLMAKDRVQSRDLQALIDGIRNIAAAADWAALDRKEKNAEVFRSAHGNSSLLALRLTSL